MCTAVYYCHSLQPPSMNSVRTFLELSYSSKTIKSLFVFETKKINLVSFDIKYPYRKTLMHRLYMRAYMQYVGHLLKLKKGDPGIGDMIIPPPIGPNGFTLLIIFSKISCMKLVIWGISWRNHQIMFISSNPHLSNVTWILRKLLVSIYFMCRVWGTQWNIFHIVVI